MGLFTKEALTPEQEAERDRLKAVAVTDKAQAKATAAADKATAKAIADAEKLAAAYAASPAGRARSAYEAGDHLFQFEMDVMNQQAIIVAMVGSNTAKTSSDPSVVINSIAHEGWDLVNASHVFVQMGQQSRDKFLASGQNVAISGATVGYYMFRRGDAPPDTQAPKSG